jgi:hypothetical protein
VPDPDLPETDRKNMFAALVVAQDEGIAVPSSRELIARRFEVTVEQVRAVEREGLERQWPPL